MNATIDFLLRLKKLDGTSLSPRCIIVLWALKVEGGQMGQELAHKLGYKTRSNLQDTIRTLINEGYIEDRRVKMNNQTPNDLWILPKGEQFLADVVPV